MLVHAISFIFRSRDKADLTSEDSERSMISKYQNINVWRHWLMVNTFMMYKLCRTAVGRTPWYCPTLPALGRQVPSFEPAMLPGPAMHTKSQLQPSTHYSSRHTVKTSHRMMATLLSQMMRSLRSGAHSEQRPVCTLTTGSIPCHWRFSCWCTSDHFVKGTLNCMCNP